MILLDENRQIHTSLKQDTNFDVKQLSRELYRE